MKYLVLIAKNLRRNLLRTTLTCLAVMLLVLIVTGVWTILWFLDRELAAKDKDFKAVVTERWQIPSQMPLAYAPKLIEAAAVQPQDVRPLDYMTWQFFGGTVDKAKGTRENRVFLFAMDPLKIRPMMEEGEAFDPGLIEKLAAKRQAVLLGQDIIKRINRQVGDRLVLTSFNYKEIELEFEIVGVCPPGRYDPNGFMNRDYLNAALDQYERQKGKQHPMVARSLNLVWLRVPDREAFSRVAEQIMAAPDFTVPAVKVETASSGIATFLEAYKDLFKFMQFVLVPFALGAIILVVTNAIGISVRERRSEMAVLKVIGFQPWQILVLVLGEALMLGAVSGLISAGATYLFVNVYWGGMKFPIAFFSVFYVPIHALWWGPAVGAGTALAGSLFPAWSASTVKPSEVFAKVA